MFSNEKRNYLQHQNSKGIWLDKILTKSVVNGKVFFEKCKGFKMTNNRITILMTTLMKNVFFCILQVVLQNFVRADVDCTKSRLKFWSEYIEQVWKEPGKARCCYTVNYYYYYNEQITFNFLSKMIIPLHKCKRLK
jgi:hypothetical protein